MIKLLYSCIDGQGIWLTYMGISGINREGPMCPKLRNLPRKPQNIRFSKIILSNRNFASEAYNSHIFNASSFLKRQNSILWIQWDVWSIILCIFVSTVVIMGWTKQTFSVIVTIFPHFWPISDPFFAIQRRFNAFYCDAS